MRLRVADLPVFLDLPAGLAGTDATVEAMRAVIDDAQASALVRAYARLYAGDPLALWGFLRAAVAFEADPIGSELLRTPDDMLASIERAGLAVGDCDDRTMLGAALAKAAGWDVSIVVMTPLPNDRTFRHVLFAVRRGAGRWVAMDAQEGFPPGEWPTAERIRAYRV